MKMKKLLSIGALSLTLVSCISIGASAAEVVGVNNKENAMESIVKNGLNSKKVFYGVEITADTKVGSYLTTNFIDETNKFLVDKDLNVYFDAEKNVDVEWKIEKSDTITSILVKVAKTLKSLDKDAKNAAVVEIKDYLLGKLSEFEDASQKSNNELISKINEYFNTKRYGELTVGTNMDNAKTVTLEKNNKILAQVNTNNVYKVADKLESVNNYDELKALIIKYYPDAQSIFDKYGNK